MAYLNKASNSILLAVISAGVLFASTPLYSQAKSADSSPDAAVPTENSGMGLYTQDTLRYQLLQKVTYGNATLYEVIQALSDTNDVAVLASTVHALYSMRYNRGVIRILDDLWTQNRDNHPDLAWESLEKIPVRIATASTLTRIRPFNNREYKSYIRDHMYDEHEFHRAQVVIALGLNADPIDVPYIKEMADGDNVYVAQSAITSLAIMANPQAREALYDLALKHSGTEKGRLIKQVILQAYPKE